MYRFYEMQGNKELNHVWKAVLALGFQDLLKGIANSLERSACYYLTQPTLTLTLLSSWPRLPIGSNWPVLETATMLPRTTTSHLCIQIFPGTALNECEADFIFSFQWKMSKTFPGCSPLEQPLKGLPGDASESPLAGFNGCVWEGSEGG